ncbi:heat-inducible transcriptional repressor HrcA [Halalkalibacillus halophilus]|uniref:heat-inducible transcriptional repressor HrcA n=1 Tax=Halalkalibacillus halophilus TaxID=392827 RepID=UPI000402DF9F|nr:heat-inducible transcriptional repressor HrcA [Halalkalibacillus halophilus]
MLTERQSLILQVIVDEFIQTAQPIGSRNIAKQEHISYSPATIRNEMADLEEAGFLSKTHSSSGRIPSEKGYRFYVDHLMSPSQLSKQEIKTIKEHFNDRMIELEKVMRNSANILSELTKYTTFVLGPEAYETKLKQIQIVPINQQSAIAILVTDSGHVEHRSFALPGHIEQGDVEKIVNILNEKLTGVPLIYLERVIQSEVVDLLQQYTTSYEQSYELLQDALFGKQASNIYVSGKSNILMQPEFNDINKARSLFNMMESEDQIAPILKMNQDGLHISIGQENNMEAMSQCTLITATYSFGEKQVGTIALLGPTRMEYSKAVSLLDLWSKQMSHSFQNWYKD